MRYLVPLLLLGCAEPFAPPDATPFDPPASYATFWQQMESCSGLSGDMRRVQWFTVPGPISAPDGSHHWGLWASRHRIYLTADMAPEFINWTVPHEMLHDLTQSGVHGVAFQRCGV